MNVLHYSVLVSVGHIAYLVFRCLFCGKKLIWKQMVLFYPQDIGSIRISTQKLAAQNLSWQFPCCLHVVRSHVPWLSNSSKRLLEHTTSHGCDML